MKRLGLLAILLTSSACSHVDTGQIDYRIADAPPTTLSTKSMAADATNNCSGAMTTLCDPILPSRVVRRYMPDPKTGWDAFQSNDVYSIEIEQGMIGSNILEGKILGREFGKTAEIAILANVFEFAGQSGDAATRRFLEAGEYPGKSDDPSDVELKLVYFGEDIRRQQAFNFSNIPLRARTAYGGGSIGIQIVVMEVDAQAGPISSLLTTLARFGQQALPGPGEAKDILFDLGESLLAGSKDDKLFEYRFVLSSGVADTRAVQATFAPGRYVLRRSQVRDMDMDWANLRLDNNTSRLFQKKKDALDNDPYVEVRSDLYMVMNVRRYPAGTAPEFYLQKDWSDFRGALQIAADVKAAPIDAVTADVGRMLVKARSGNWGNGLALKWSTARNLLETYGIRYAALTTKCDDVQMLRDLDVSEREARDAIRNFRAEYQQAAAAERKDETGKAIGPEFQQADREKLVSLVSTFFLPWTTTGADRTAFAGADPFEKTMIDASANGDLALVALTAAAKRADGSAKCNVLPT
ncbi:hypothetical protein [Sphingobium sp. SYK-6]|uniref:hypothetical protein n=1 Tax=Sphingobium sp. (strain NBRC 103272 / SYK-6) TaxID=627192 RepID=UPI0003182908|nr:hypothetical protein [Sphingobium sp. SYK-6]